MAYASWSVVFGEQPSAAKWNILGLNDASFNDGTGLNNGSVQQFVSTTFSAVATGTTLMPLDDTIPQITEGDQYMTQVITPTSLTNILKIEVKFYGANSAASGHLTAALFQDATANALAASSQFFDAGGSSTEVTIIHTMAAGTTSATTFRVRAGSNTAGTTTFNGLAGGRFFGAIPKSAITITEHKA